MTNIISNIIVITNIFTNSFTTDNHKGCATCQMIQDMSRKGMMPAIYHPSHIDGLPYVPASEKEEVVQVIREEVLSFKWNGSDRSITNLVIISEKKKKYIKNNDWIEIK